jgi:hypothetical protein
MLGRCTAPYADLTFPSVTLAGSQRFPKTAATPERTQPVSVTLPPTIRVDGQHPPKTAATPGRTQPVSMTMLPAATTHQPNLLSVLSFP